MYVFLIYLIIVIFPTNIYFYCNIRYEILSDAFNKDVYYHYSYSSSSSSSYYYYYYYFIIIIIIIIIITIIIEKLGTARKKDNSVLGEASLVFLESSTSKNNN